ncbi:hypothetical protein POSPLADRAFT_1033713 [Postia placenta MAD-698-R-SB12]|uniref:Uncharacterized protein n=1 Tax=Postia placenta MAD-698-R-SB12 TaxID=670580 RepID=A0A1X6N005_9APHY|nr:hypothetical protein POSPLADRAFT_1033713 [Postia placenta MAD-698-R-SB12]OSX61944.1 hypothetical protein POSPLADRAFT_1033713 [Postia placenta MAD-698-R-SB12]
MSRVQFTGVLSSERKCILSVVTAYTNDLHTWRATPLGDRTDSIPGLENCIDMGGPFATVLYGASILHQEHGYCERGSVACEPTDGEERTTGSQDASGRPPAGASHVSKPV